MVANLAAHKAGWDDQWNSFSIVADKGQQLLDELLHLVDEDTEAFQRIMAAFGLPKGSEAEKSARSKAIQQATLYAAEVPLRTMKAAIKVFPLCRDMAERGNPASVSDAGVGALAARAAVIGAGLNVRINAASLKDRTTADALIAEAQALTAQAIQAEREIMDIVETKL
jgi:glutamate formiminotransferase/formiminotetrahydrofolate cyclodeaminase